MRNVDSCDLAIVGGGLAGGLIALAVRQQRPGLRIRLIESSSRFGGNHVWSFFGSDVADAHRPILAPLVVHAWPGYDVLFPGHRRTLRSPYYSIESERLDQVLRERLPEDALVAGRRVLGVGASAVVLEDGGRIEAAGVIDARGPADFSSLDLGWQKFVGQELELEAPHGLERPVVMDATVAQLDGYRFVYVLPFDERRVFVEDTYYSDFAQLSWTPKAHQPDVVAPRIADYAAGRGWKIARVLRTEQGALPVAMGGDFEAYWRAGGDKVGHAGMRAGLFHPLTGYSLPDAVRTAAAVAAAPDLSSAALNELLRDRARDAWKTRGFYRMLSAMLFRAARPQERYRVLERFYRLDARLIGRFYAGRSTLADKARVLIGRPPVPIGAAVSAIWPKERRK